MTDQTPKPDYPDIHREMHRAIDDIFLYPGKHRDDKLNFLLGEQLAKQLIPELGELILDQANIVADVGNFGDSPHIVDLIAERLVCELATFLTSQAVDRENAARLHWFEEVYVRSILNYPTLEEWAAQQAEKKKDE